MIWKYLRVLIFGGLVVPMQSRILHHIILDAGSSGTRFYLFSHNLHDDTAAIRVNSTVIGRVKPGMSELDDEGKLLTQVSTLFTKAADRIPEELRKDVPVWFLGTAGMRSIDKAMQTKIWERVLQYQGFKLFNPNITAHTISGRTEGLFSLTCVNHLATQDSTMRDNRPFGILDLGGSSTQIAKPPLDGDELYIQSFPNAGMDVTHVQLGLHAKACEFKGYASGSAGNASACREVIQEIIAPVLESQIRNASVATSPTMNFVAVSGYVYVVDFVHNRTSIPGFPRPSLKDLEDKVAVLCATEWATIERDSREKPHAFTHSVKKASLRCYEANYIVTLLRWYGFTDTEQRVSFIDEIGGNSLEWPLGALVNHFEKRDASRCGLGDCDVHEMQSEQAPRK